MRLTLTPESHVRIALRASGLLKAVGHTPTLIARPNPLSVSLPDGPVDAPVHATFRADAIEVPAGLSPTDHERMRENLLGRDVLDATRFPTVDLAARYTGTTTRGTLSGTLNLRGVEYPLELSVETAADGPHLRTHGAWEGKLTSLGIKPFSALFGALKLADWVRLTLDARFVRG